MTHETPQTRNARWSRAAGIDFHILRTLLFRGWSLIAGGATALLVPYCLGPIQQGYYFTFVAVLASQIFFELGLNHVLTQLAGHLAAHLQRNERGTLEGPSRWQHSIASLLARSRVWNGLTAVMFFAVLLIAGSWFFRTKGTLPISQWLSVWVVLLAATATNLAMSARLAICEGIGEIGQVAQLRLKQSMLGYVLLWALLLTGQGLWAIVAIPSASALCTAAWLLRNESIKQLLATSPDIKSTITWRHDVFPLQWRIALSWASGFFIFSFLTPTIFANQGPKEAGQVGLALTIFSSISTIGISWVSAKIPVFSAHIARHEREALDTLFRHQAIRSIAATTVIVMGFIAAIYLLMPLMPVMVTRLPSMTTLLLLGAVTIANAAIFSMAAYVRAHKEEPLLAQSLTTAFLVAMGVYWMSQHSVQATVASYAAVVLLVSLPWCCIIYRQYRNRI